MTDHQRATRARQYVLDAGWIQVRKVDQDSHLLAAIHYGQAERREPLWRRARRRDQPAVAGQVTANVGEADAANAQLVEGPEKMDVRGERLDPFHGDEESDPALGTRSIDLSVIAADGESGIVSNLLVQERKLVDRNPKRQFRQVAVVEKNGGAD